MNFIPIQTFGNYIDAHIMMGRMQEEGIECWSKDENLVTLNAAPNSGIGIKLMVGENQVETAMLILQQMEQEKKNRFSCPQCYSHNIQFGSTLGKASNWLIAIRGFLFKKFAVPADKTWHCSDCGAEFDEPVEQSTEKMN
jgi:ribosomal protein L37AE/L43A